MDKYSKRVAIKVILLSQLLSESLDEAEETTFYNHSLKNLLNKVARKLKPFNRKHYDGIYDDKVAEGIDVLDTIADQLTHCEVEGFEAVQAYNIYMVKDAYGNSKKIKSVLEPDEFNKKYKTITE